MTPPSAQSTQDHGTQAAQHDDPHPTAVCPASPEGAMPLQSATLSHKNSAIPNPGSIAAEHYADWWLGQKAMREKLSNPQGQSVMVGGDRATKFVAEYGPDAVPRETSLDAQICRFSLLPERDRLRMLAQFDRECQEAAKPGPKLPENHAPVDAREVEAMRWADSLKNVRLQVNPNDFGYIMTWEAKPGIARYATVRSEVCDRALTRTALTSEQADKQIFEVQNEALTRAVAIELYLEVGSSIARSVERACDAPVPEEIVNVRGEQRSVDEYCVATPVPCTIPSVGEALAMREMVEKAAEVMRGRGAAMPERSFLSLPRQHDSPLSARVVPKGEAPDPKVGW